MSTGAASPASAPTRMPTSPVLVKAGPPSKGPAVTPSTGRACSNCNGKFPRDSFSKVQWEANAHSRKCKNCVVKLQQQQLNQPVVASTPQPAATKGKVGSKLNSKAGAVNRPPPSSKPVLTPQQQAAQAAAARAAALAAAKSQQIKKTQRKKLPGAEIDLLVDDEKTQDSWFSPRAEAVLTEIFNKFDEDKDLAWSVAETQNFALATNGVQFTTEELNEIRDNLHHDAKGNWTLKGFLDFYHLQTSSHPDETWKDIMKLGYNDKLEHTGISYQLKEKQLPSEAVAQHGKAAAETPKEEKK